MSAAMLLTLILVVALLFFETLLQAFVRRLDSQLPGRTPAGDAPKLPDVVARCVRVAVLIGVALTVAQTWVVDVLGLVNQAEWDQLTRSSRTAGITLFAAFVLWEAFKYATDPYMARKSAGALPAPGTAMARPRAPRALDHHAAVARHGGGRAGRGGGADRAGGFRRQHRAPAGRRVGASGSPSRSAARRWCATSCRASST